MGTKAEDMKGRAKSAVGELTDDDQLRREGKVDQASAATKRTVENVVDKAKHAVTSTKR